MMSNKLYNRLHSPESSSEANAIAAIRSSLSPRVTQDNIDETPIEGQATPLNSVDAVEPWVQWTLYILGILLGGIVEFVANWDDWPCLSDIAGLLESAYLIYFYIASYISTGDAEDIAYATLYLVKGFESGFDINCGAGSEFGSVFEDHLSLKTGVYQPSSSNKWSSSISALSPEVRLSQIALRASPWVMADADSVYTAFDWVYRILGELNEIVGLIEAVLDVFTVI